MIYRKHKTIKLNPEGLRLWGLDKVRLQWTVPAFTHLLYRMMNPDDTEQVAVFTMEVKRAATDGKRLLLNPDWYFPLPDSQRVFVNCHEIGHSLFMHPAQFYLHRKEDRGVYWNGKTLPFLPKVANYAADFVINAMLIESKIGTMPPGGLYDDKIATSDTSWQEAYHRIWEECESNTSKGNGSEPRQGGSDQDEEDGEGVPQDPGDKDERGKTKRFEQGQFDSHLEPGATDQLKPSDSKAMPDPQRWTQAIIGAKAVAQGTGNMPAALEKVLDNLLKPKVTWTDHIEGLFARKVHGHAYDFRRLDRRLIVRNIGAPGKSGHGCGTIVVAMDSSGSIYAVPDLIERFFGETAGIFEQLNPRRIIVIWCDAEVQATFEIEDTADLMSCYYKGAVGGGGTYFKPPFDWLEEHDIEDVDAMVYLTDGDNADKPELAAMDVPKYPVIWGCIAEGKSFPFGDVVKVPDDGTA